MPSREESVLLAHFAMRVLSVRTHVVCLLISLHLLYGCDQRSSIGAPPKVELSSNDEVLEKFIAEQYREALANPESGLHRGRLAMAYDANGFRETAALTYDQAHKLSPNVFLWPYLQAHLYKELGDIENALDSVNKSLNIQADYAPAYISRGVWLLDAGNYEEALLSLGEATDHLLDASQKRAVDAYSALAHFRLGDPQSARELLEPYIGDDMHPQIARQLTQIYQGFGLSDLATKFAVRGEQSGELRWVDQKAASKLAYVKSFSGSLLLAEELIENKNALRAISILEELLDSYPDEESVVNNLAIAYKVKGAKKEALNLLRTALESNPNSHLLHFNIGVIYEEMGDIPKAIDHLGRSIEIKENLLPAYERKVQLLIKTDRLAEAYVDIQAALGHSDSNVGIYFLAGILAGLQDDWSQSTEYFERLLDLDPFHAKAHSFLIRSLIAQARIEEADVALREAERLQLHLDNVEELRQSLESFELVSRSQQ